MMRKRLSKDRARRPIRIGIQWKMYAILILFICITVCVIWFLQVQLMNFFFQVTKYKELEHSATALSAELDHPLQLERVADEYAKSYITDIWVFRLDHGKIDAQLAGAKGTGEGAIADMNRKFDFLRRSAEENGGRYIALVSMEQFHEDWELQIRRDNSGDSSAYPYIGGRSERMCALYVTVHTQMNGEYLIVQATNLIPVQAMVKTLQDQSLWTGVILAIVALLMAWIMSRLITKPIVNMNESAKKLALGNYDADFEGKGYREISELADTLNYASRELAKTDQLQKELISNISHDLRTPLTMIKGYSEVMRDIPGENSPENIQIIIDETSRLSELVNDMLDLSKIRSGTRSADMQVFSLTATVRDTMQRYERLMMQENYVIDFVADREVEVLADRGMILQMIYNLINNAINYTGDDKRVSVRQDVVGDRVRISATDTGAGIAKEDLGMIWDRYYRVDKVHRRATVGTGLGLSIVKGILELHHAVFGVQSALGEGSTFWFELTCADADESGPRDYIEADYEIQQTEETV